MSRKHHEVEGAGGGDASCKAVWDTGSSLYDSYELAAVRRLLDKRLIAAAGVGVGVLPLPDELSLQAAAAAGETSSGNKSTQVVVPASSRVHHRRKVTLRALFRAVATWAARPRRAPPPLVCACSGTGMVHDQSGGGGDLPSHGQL